MYKIKTAWYCELNKTLDLISRSRSLHGSEMNVWKVILEEKYDDLRTWLAEEDRQAMDRFAQDLLKEVGLIPKRLQETVLDAKRCGMDKRKFASFVAAQTEDKALEKALLFHVWSMYDADDPKTLSDDSQSGPQGEIPDNGDKLALIREEVIKMILKNCSKRPLFEKARMLVGSISYCSSIKTIKTPKLKPA